MIIRRREMVTSKVFVCLVYLCSLFIKQSEQCIVRESGALDLPSFQDYRDNGVERITLHHQAIIPSYEFTCCGNITEWGVDVEPGGGRNDGEYTLDLQVWRPSPTVDDSTGAGQYSLVGNNRFSAISLANDVAVVTPLSRDQVQFRPGDVIGFYVEEARDNYNDRGVNVLTTASYTSERVWYASVTTLSTMCCPVSAGGSGVLNTVLRGAPVISIASETYACPTATTTTPQPTMPPTVPTDPDPPTDPVTEDSTTSDMVTHNPTLSPTPTEASTDTDLTTDPASSVTSDDNRMPSTGRSGQGTVIAIVVAVAIITIIPAILVALLIAFTVLKKRGKEFTVTHTDFNAGISVSTATNPDYDVIDLKSTTATNPRIANHQDVDASLEYDIVTKQNDAYISVAERRDGARDAIVTETNEAYISNSATGSGNGARDAIITETNEAYISNSATGRGDGARDVIITETNEAYISNSATGSGNGASVAERRDGARDAIITETNAAYISNSATGSGDGARDVIVTGRNEAYSVTSRSANTETETVDEYDYI